MEDANVLCEYCGHFFSVILYTLHVLQTHRDRLRLTFFCTFKGCSKKFETDESRLLHEQTDHESWMTCTPCNITFSNSQSCIAHNVRVHNSKKYFNCPFCPRIYLSSHGWEKHMKINHQPIYNQGLHHYNEKKFAPYKKKPLCHKILPPTLLNYFLK